jgi:hypothetical protein
MTEESGEGVEKVRRRGMRTGFTTGACATAAAKAATRALLAQQPVSEVTIRLPIGRDATFQIVSFELKPDSCRCAVIKDAGDDPDVTHGAAIVARVSWLDQPGRIDLAGQVDGRAFEAAPQITGVWGRDRLAKPLPQVQRFPLNLNIINFPGG